MKLLFMLALGLLIRPILAVTEYKGVVQCDNKGDSFAVVLPTDPDGTMEIKKLYHEFPVEFTIQEKDVHKFKGYVCMKHHEIVFSQVIQLPTTPGTHALKSGDTFTWEAGLSELSLSSEKTGKVIDTWMWILDDIKRIAELSKVDADDLEHILK